jgi:pimeloyl-ACP methyl ester carboxylesterase
MIAWAGGRYPGRDGRLYFAEATSSSYAQDLGPKLHAFMDGISTADGTRRTVTGHSYGGAVVAAAEMDGLDGVDGVLYVSSAGLGKGVESISQFPGTKDTPHYAMMARNDGIVGGIQKQSMHGASPLYDPDVPRLEFGFREDGNHASGTAEAIDPVKAHSAAYSPGSTGFNGIVGVATGTQVELFAENAPLLFGKFIWVDGIKHPDYEPDILDLRKWEKE